VQIMPNIRLERDVCYAAASQAGVKSINISIYNP
jgi:hypothetical protein